MKKKLPLAGCAALLSIGLGVYAQTAAPQKPAVTPVASATAEHALFDQYCFDCHSGNGAEAGMHLDKLDTANVEKDAEKWEKVVRKLRAGMMPPSGMPRPDRAGYEGMIEWLENELDRHAVTNLPPPGLHRLNRTEYANAIRDLLALSVDPGTFVPPDDSTRGFDNVAAGLLRLLPMTCFSTRRSTRMMPL